jgi:hypothetical protein
MTRAEYWDGDEWRDLLDDVLEEAVTADALCPYDTEASAQAEALICYTYLVNSHMREMCKLVPNKAEQYQEECRDTLDKLARELVAVIGPGRARMHVVRPGKMQCDECG